MIIISIKTNEPESQLGLHNDHKLLGQTNYQADRDLAATIHVKILELLEGFKLNWQDIEGIVCFRGPGSFTGLRIGLTVANSLAYSLNRPIVGTMGSDWLDRGIEGLLNNQNEYAIMPFYGAEPHITKAKK